MYYKFLFILIFSFSTHVFSFNNMDTTTVEDEDFSSFDDFSVWEFDNFSFRLSGRPTISLNYGMSNIGLNNFGQNFDKTNFAEFKIGYTSERPTWVEQNILRYKYRYIYGANHSQNFGGKKENANDVETDLWRFGFGRTSGLGYHLGKSSAIIPYYGYTFGWSHLNIKSPVLTADDQTTAELYNESIRFGTSGEAGVRIQIVPQFTIEAGYEKSLIFPRHMFWKHAGSVLIETAVQSAVDRFVNEVLEVSPYAAPIVNFVLKNGVSLAMNQLRKEKMNWPFDTASPITYDQIKLGLTFVF